MKIKNQSRLPGRYVLIILTLVCLLLLVLLLTQLVLEIQ